MSAAKRCRICGTAMEARRENYKYDASGLLLRLMVIVEKPVQSYALEELATQEPRYVRTTLAPR